MIDLIKIEIIFVSVKNDLTVFICGKIDIFRPLIIKG